MSTPEPLTSEKIVEDLIFRFGVESTQGIVEEDDILLGVDGPGQRLLYLMLKREKRGVS